MTCKRDDSYCQGGLKDTNQGSRINLKGNNQNDKINMDYGCVSSWIGHLNFHSVFSLKSCSLHIVPTESRRKEKKR